MGHNQDNYYEVSRNRNNVFWAEVFYKLKQFPPKSGFYSINEKFYLRIQTTLSTFQTNHYFVISDELKPKVFKFSYPKHEDQLFFTFPIEAIDFLGEYNPELEAHFSES